MKGLFVSVFHGPQNGGKVLFLWWKFYDGLIFMMESGSCLSSGIDKSEAKFENLIFDPAIFNLMFWPSSENIYLWWLLEYNSRNIRF